MLMFVFFSFSIFASLEPISDSAPTLGVIDDAMDQLDALKEEHFIDAGGKDIPLTRCDIEFSHVDFGYDSRRVLKDVGFRIPEKITTAIVGPSGSGKTTICSLIARFYDPQSGSITVGGHGLREFSCDSLPPIFLWCFRTCTCSTIRSAKTSFSVNRTPRRRRWLRRPRGRAAMSSSWLCRAAMIPPFHGDPRGGGGMGRMGEERT